MIPEGLGKPGHLYTVSYGKTGQLGTYKLETQMTSGNGKFERTGINSDAGAREAMDSAYRYLRANYGSVSQSISLTTKDFVVHVQDMNGIGMTKTLSLPTIIALCSVSLNKPVLPSLVILGDITIGGSMIKVDNLANCLQVAKDAGAKKVLVPMISAADIGTVPPELMGTFNLIFYQTPEDAVFKALGVE